MKTKVYKSTCKDCGNTIRSVIGIKHRCGGCEMKLYPEKFSSIPGLNKYL